MKLDSRILTREGRGRRWPLALVAALIVSPAIAGPEALWLKAADGVEVRADLYRVAGEGSEHLPVALLFHQARSNRAEYASIAPRLNELGFHALAIDQRSGADGRGVVNETVARLGRSTGYFETGPDFEAALAWKKGSGLSGPTVIWGSSYSAAMVFLVAAEHAEIAGVLSFSPGEYLGKREDEVRRAAAGVYQPVLILAPEAERRQAQAVIDALGSSDKLLVVPDEAVHGSSMLIVDANPGAAEVWRVVEQFLKRFH